MPGETMQDALAWIRDDLKTEPYYKTIARSESERGSYDAAASKQAMARTLEFFGKHVG